MNKIINLFIKMESNALLTEKDNEVEEIIKSEKFEYIHNGTIYDIIIILTKSQILFKCRENKNRKNNDNNIIDEQYFNTISNIKYYYAKYTIPDLIKIAPIFIIFQKDINKIYNHIKSLINSKKLKIEIIKNNLILNFEFSLNTEQIPIKIKLNEIIIDNEIIKFFYDDFNGQIVKLQERIKELSGRNVCSKCSKFQNEVEKLKIELENLKKEKKNETNELKNVIEE